MSKYIICLLGILLFPFFSNAQSILSSKKIDDGYQVIVSADNSSSITSPEEGLWSIAIGWENDWPSNWQHANPDKIQEVGDWKIVSGTLELPSGRWLLQDAYRTENNMVKCIRRFEWEGQDTLDKVTLSVRWKVPGTNLQAFLPSILHYGNPSGEKNSPESVTCYHGRSGEMAIFEEHRYPMPFACLESGKDEIKYGAAIHTIPSPIKNSKKADQWWSMGVAAYDGYSELLLLSGPVTYNNQKSVVKALHHESVEYGDTFLEVLPGTIIEKIFFLDVNSIHNKGTAFQKPLQHSLDIFKPYNFDDLPSYEEILHSKYRYTKSRWIEGSDYAGFNMYPENIASHIVMGWCGQAASCGYAFQVLKKHFADPELPKMVQLSLDFLSNSPVNENGFPVRYNINSNSWSDPDHVSMGQAMFNFAKAIKTGRQSGDFKTEKWEKFLKEACDFASQRIMDENWFPQSTAEAFYIAPLAVASNLFKVRNFELASIKAATHYAKRHLSMEEPYWGGTLDASCEDKEGAWAAFQGFLAVYELTKDKTYLDWAKHACDVCISYTVVWDIPLPPGRLANHALKTRGWTAVSAQNQHIDAFGVFFAPEIYRMGQILEDENLKKLAVVMYRSCGQLIDPFGSHGEQIQQTNWFLGNNRSVLRGGYSEGWTVFWITAHFLNAAARFEEMGVNLDTIE